MSDKNERSLEERILEKIVGSLQSGEKLPTEKQMAEEFQVSRTMIREALSVFEANGIVIAQKGSGRYVQMPDVSGQITDGWKILIRSKPELLLELLEIRAVLELGFLPRAIDRLELHTIQKLKQLVDDMLRKSEQSEDFVHEDKEFHRLLFSGTDNILLEQLLKAFWDLYEESNATRNHQDLRQIAEVHRQLLEAIVRKNAEQAANLMKQQFEDARFRISMSLA
ncbi:FadR/GntR family transcriptional regulator [Cohnella laeviribosi]|jgi:DNA-binding FadR family transcriptional regulator|uniref:FadR/GntR family transcriptional regulator n=1 Tax=Cohnella laeviribosi TaxID=380174 RepID=UPI0003636108|nr:FCD domain-containing protein [Cohnella laeviribosi]